VRPLARVKVSFSSWARKICEVLEEVRDGLKHVFQDPPPDLGELFKLPSDDFIRLVWSSQNQSHSI